MAEPLSVRIVRVKDQALVEAAAIPVTVGHLVQTRGWRKLLVRQQEPDQAWDWASFLQEADDAERAGRGRFESFALVVRTKLQAMMLLETRARASRTDGKPLVYVEYLAVAPHNRPTAASRRYKRCGEAMLAVALHRSSALGHHGRVGLHALPSSVAFYMKMGLRDFGEDPQENGLHYFELARDVLESA